MRPIRMTFKKLTFDWIDKLESRKWLKPIILEQMRARVDKNPEVDKSTRGELLKYLVEEKELLTELMAKTAKNWIL
jgi:uncharacterized Fe-S cluster-containing radical SAM superfamily enzyme